MSVVAENSPIIDLSKFERILTAIEKISGVVLRGKEYILENRVSELLARANIPSFDEAARMLEDASEGHFRERLIDLVTTHETRFFRDESIYTALTEQIIPEWMDRNGVTAVNAGTSNARLQIWSAGCSSGQEVYSLAISILERHPGLAPITTIIGTDIAQITLSKAQAGIYSDFEVNRGVPAHLLDRYFQRHGHSFTVTPRVRALTQFRPLNLLKDPVPGLFDMVFFRNVAIYFSDETKKTLFPKLQSAVKRDGVFVIGSSESVNGFLSDYVIREFGLSRYYEVNCANVTFYGRAGTRIVNGSVAIQSRPNV